MKEPISSLGLWPKQFKNSQNLMLFLVRLSFQDGFGPDEKETTFHSVLQVHNI